MESFELIATKATIVHPNAQRNAEGIRQKPSGETLCVRPSSSIFSDGTVFDEITESRFVCDGVQTDPLRVRDWDRKYQQLSRLTEDRYVWRGLIDTKAGTAVPIFPLKLISIVFFTSQCPYPDNIIRAALCNVVCEDDDFKKLKEDEM